MENLIQKPGLNHLFVAILRHLDVKSIKACRKLCSQSTAIIDESKIFYICQFEDLLRDTNVISKYHFQGLSMLAKLKVIFDKCFKQTTPSFMKIVEENQQILCHFTEKLKLSELKLISRSMKTYFEEGYIQKLNHGFILNLHPILWAIKNDELELLALFDRFNINFNITDRLGKTPLHSYPVY